MKRRSGKFLITWILKNSVLVRSEEAPVAAVGSRCVRYGQNGQRLLAVVVGMWVLLVELRQWRRAGRCWLEGCCGRGSAHGGVLTRSQLERSLPMAAGLHTFRFSPGVDRRHVGRSFHLRLQNSCLIRCADVERGGVGRGALQLAGRVRLTPPVVAAVLVVLQLQVEFLLQRWRDVVRDGISFKVFAWRVTVEDVQIFHTGLHWLRHTALRTHEGSRRICRHKIPIGFTFRLSLLLKQTTDLNCQ